MFAVVLDKVLTLLCRNDNMFSFVSSKSGLLKPSAKLVGVLLGFSTEASFTYCFNEIMPFLLASILR